MKSFRKYVITPAILCAAGMTALCACGQEQGTPQQPAATEQTVSRPTAPADNMMPGTAGVTAQPAEVPMIPGEDSLPWVGMVISQSGIDDASFNQSAWEGLQWLEGSMDCHTMIVEAGGDAGITEQEAMEQLVQAGCDLCWGVGVNCADAVLASAEKYPDVNFAIVDTTYENLPENVTAVVFRAEEPSFLVGYVAGSVTETRTVGFIGGEQNAVIDAFYYGFLTGVAEAAEDRGEKIETIAVYTDSFDDADKGYEMAKSLYAQDCDVIYQAAGASGLGVIRAAEEEDKYVIGVDKDQSYLSPEHVLCSALKYVNVSVKQVSEGLLKDDIVPGQTITLGLSENAVGISEDHSLYSQEIYDNMLELQMQIIAGDLTVPSAGE